MKKIILSVIILIILFSGCASSPPADPEDKEKIISSAYDSVFEATKRTFMEMGVEITGGSKESGFLNGKKNLNTAVLTTFMTGTARTIFTYYEVSFIENGESTTVLCRITTSYSDGTYPNKGRKDDYVKFWENVNKYL